MGGESQGNGGQGELSTVVSVTHGISADRSDNQTGNDISCRRVAHRNQPLPVAIVSQNGFFLQIVRWCGGASGPSYYRDMGSRGRE